MVRNVAHTQAQEPGRRRRGSGEDSTRTRAIESTRRAKKRLPMGFGAALRGLEAVKKGRTHCSLHSAIYEWGPGRAFERREKVKSAAISSNHSHQQRQERERREDLGHPQRFRHLQAIQCPLSSRPKSLPRPPRTRQIKPERRQMEARWQARQPRTPRSPRRPRRTGSRASQRRMRAFRGNGASQGTA